MSGVGTEIFIVTIKDIQDASDDNFEVYAEGAEDEAKVVHFVTNKGFDEDILKLHGRLDLGFATELDHDNGCARIGEHLFNTFFTGSVLKRYRDYRQRNDPDPPRIALQISQSLYYLPWEVLRDPSENRGQFLSVAGSLIRYDLQSSQPEDTLYVDSADSRTYLFLLASLEAKPIGPYEPEDGPFATFLKVEPATYVKFGERLRKTRPEPFGLVFFGHGDVLAGQGHLFFIRQWRQPFSVTPEADPKAGLAVGREIGALKRMRIAYIFACESAWAARKSNFEYSIAGSILLRSRLAYVIGAQTPIDFFAAQGFFIRTLQALADNYPLDLAITEGRRAVQGISPIGEGRGWSGRDWWVPVLYARTTNFDILPTRREITASEVSPRETVPAKASYLISAAANLIGRLISSTDNEPTKDLLSPRS
jgi:hypothetical protein